MSQLTVTRALPPVAQTPVGAAGGGKLDAAVRGAVAVRKPGEVAVRVMAPVLAVDWTMTCAKPLKTAR